MKTEIFSNLLTIARLQIDIFEDEEGGFWAECSDPRTRVRGKDVDEVIDVLSEKIKARYAPED